MPVSGIADNDLGVIAFLFTGVIVIEDIISAHQTVSKTVRTGQTYMEINLFDHGSQYHELNKERMSQLKQAIMDCFDRNDIFREKIASIELSTQISLINPLWRALVTTDAEIKSEYAAFKTVEEGCNWLGISEKTASDLLDKLS